MCGRTALFCNADGVLQESRASRWTKPLTERGFRRSFNNGPMRRMPIMTRTSDSSAPQLEIMKWGIFTNTKNHTERGTLSINARDDTLLSSASTTWNPLRDSYRCLVPAQGYFEWKGKSPYFVYSESLCLKDKESTSNGSNTSGFLFYAAIYQPPMESVKDSEADLLPSFAIITTSASPELEWLHDRMPVILTQQEDRDAWLDQNLPFSAVKHLLKPLQSGLNWHEVDPCVNKIANDSIECIVPFKEKQGSLFKFLVPQVSNVLPTASPPSPETRPVVTEPVELEHHQQSAKRKLEDLDSKSSSPLSKKAAHAKAQQSKVGSRKSSTPSSSSSLPSKKKGETKITSFFTKQ